MELMLSQVNPNQLMSATSLIIISSRDNSSILHQYLLNNYC